MKLKRFKQFVNEARVNEDTSAIVEESAFLVDGVVYQVGEVELEIETSYEAPDSDVGYYGGYSAESWTLYGIDNVYKVVEPDFLQKLEQVRKESEELHGMGFSDLDKQNRIDELIWEADTVEVTGEELAALDRRVTELYKANQLVDLTGNFEERCESAVERAMEDYEDDGPDYDY